MTALKAIFVTNKNLSMNKYQHLHFGRNSSNKTVKNFK